LDLILNINKEKSISSFDVVRFLRRKFGEKRIGFKGTLDPFAEGVLPIFTGSFTKIIPYVDDSLKEYSFDIQLGIETDTLDVTGDVIKRMDYPNKIESDNLEEIVKVNFIDEYIQKIPEFSAVKIRGVPSYKLARKGEEIESRSKIVKIFGFTLLSADNGVISGSIKVSPGFYVRQFASDLGRVLGTCASLSNLRRERSGFFGIEDSVGMKNANEKMSLDIRDVLGKNMKIMNISDEIAKDLKNGRSISNDDTHEGLCLALNENQSRCFIVRSSSGMIKTERMIY